VPVSRPASAPQPAPAHGSTEEGAATAAAPGRSGGDGREEEGRGGGGGTRAGAAARHGGRAAAAAGVCPCDGGAVQRTCAPMALGLRWGGRFPANELWPRRKRGDRLDRLASSRVARGLAWGRQFLSVRWSCGCASASVYFFFEKKREMNIYL
jgi:hypothetical protein